MILYIDLCLGIVTDLMFCFRNYVITFVHFLEILAFKIMLFQNNVNSFLPYKFAYHSSFSCLLPFSWNSSLILDKTNERDNFALFLILESIKDEVNCKVCTCL